MVLILKKKEIVSVDVFYFIPRTRILNEFVWQFEDEVPDIPRVHEFLNYWHENIDAVIHQVLVSHSGRTAWKKYDFEEKLH